MKPTLRQGLAALVVTIAVLPALAQADWPVATPDAISAMSNQSLNISVLANDTGDHLQLVEVNQTTKRGGKASINSGNQTVTYQSANDFVGTDSFWYAFKDSQGRTNSAKVTITVTEESQKPAAWPGATNDQAETTINTPITLSPLANDNGVGLTFTEVNSITVKLGKVTVNADGKTLQYTPPENYTGSDSFWYAFSDGWGRTNAGKVMLLVKEENGYIGWPQAVGDSAQTTLNTSTEIPVLDNDQGNGLRLLEVNAHTKKSGQAEISGNKVLYTPAQGFTGEDSFWYAFEDNQGRTNSTKVIINVVENNVNSTIAFCDATYSTDGTAEGTFVTQQAAEESTHIGGAELVTFPEQADGNFAIVGERRYYLEETSTRQKLMVEVGGVSKTVANFLPSDTLSGIRVFNNTLYYSVAPLVTGPFAFANIGLYSHDGELNTAHGRYAGEIKALDNSEQMYFYYFSNGPHAPVGWQHFRLNEAGEAVLVKYHRLNMMGPSGNPDVSSIFNYQGLDYYSIRNYVSPRAPANITLYYSSIYQATSDGQSTSLTIPGVIDKVALIQNRVLMTTVGHTELTYDASIVHLPRLYTINAENEFVLLDECE